MSDCIVHKCITIVAEDKDVDGVLNVARKTLSHYHIDPRIMYVPSHEDDPRKITTVRFAVENYASNLQDKQNEQMDLFMRELNDELNKNNINHSCGISGGGGFFAEHLDVLRRIYKTAQLHSSLDDLIREKRKCAETGNSDPVYPTSKPIRHEPWRQFENWQMMLMGGGEVVYAYETQQMTDQEEMRLEHVLQQNNILFENKVISQENPKNTLQNEKMIVAEDNPKRMIQISNVSEERFWQLMTNVTPQGQDGTDNDGWQDVKNWHQLGTEQHSSGLAWVYDLKNLDLSNREKLKNFLEKSNIGFTEIEISRGKGIRYPIIEIHEQSEVAFLKTMRSQNNKLFLIQLSNMRDDRY